MKVRANGKLLLTGEYFVMRGAKALALPCQMGQTLELTKSSGSEIMWKSYDHLGEEWFNAKIDLFNFNVEKTNNPEVAAQLVKLINAASRLNSDFLSQWKKYRIKTVLEFNPEWGLGSSSTLIDLIAQWAEIDAFDLYFSVYEGSGYDVACASATGPIIYEVDDESLEVEEVSFKPGFSDQIYFLYSGKKKNTQEALDEVSQRLDKISVDDIKKITDIGQDILSVSDLNEFITKLKAHDAIVSKFLDQPAVMEEQFSDFDGYVKSLGAWGGDFYLVASSLPIQEIKKYFKTEPLIPFSEMVLLPAS